MKINKYVKIHEKNIHKIFRQCYSQVKQHWLVPQMLPIPGLMFWSDCLPLLAPHQSDCKEWTSNNNLGLRDHEMWKKSKMFVLIFNGKVYTYSTSHNKLLKHLKLTSRHFPEYNASDTSSVQKIGIAVPKPSGLSFHIFRLLPHGRHSFEHICNNIDDNSPTFLHILVVSCNLRWFHVNLW